jgi:hypothetical protein
MCFSMQAVAFITVLCGKCFQHWQLNPDKSSHVSPAFHQPINPAADTTAGPAIHF